MNQRDEIAELFRPHVKPGRVTIDGVDPLATSINILRDTASAQSILLADVFDLPLSAYTERDVIVETIHGLSYLPIYRVILYSPFLTGSIEVAVGPNIPVKGVSMILGNDLMLGDTVIDSDKNSEKHCDDNNVTPAKVIDRGENPIELSDDNTRTEVVDSHKNSEKPCDDGICAEITGNPTCAITRSAKQSQNETVDVKEPTGASGLRDKTEVDSRESGAWAILGSALTFLREQLIKAQRDDLTMKQTRSEVLDNKNIGEKVQCFYEQEDALMQKYRDPAAPADCGWRTSHKVVLTARYRSHVLSLAHENVLACNLGAKNTRFRILRNFWWPSLKVDAADYSKTCMTCQTVGKAGDMPRKAPLQPIPAFNEAFSKVIIDLVGPLERTKRGHEYILTIMCSSTRFPSAFPLRNIKSKTVITALLDFVTVYSLPTVVQSDQGSCIMANLF